MGVRAAAFAFVHLVVSGILLLSCGAHATPPAERKPVRSIATKEQEREIRSLIEQLVFTNAPASDEPLINPRIIDSVRTTTNAKQELDNSQKMKDYRKRFESCQSAFRKLTDFKGLAFPFLIEHLDDARQSIPFRNHFTGFSVGDACYWNIYFQLQDRPQDYSEYGYQRKGRDGKSHPKPYWDGTPFDDAGGLKKWVEKNKEVPYTEMQIKCLRWLLDKEKEIGAFDADSYFLNILPLEIRILQRKREAGKDVAKELNRLQEVLKKKDVKQIPPGLLPNR